jgi:hypothetical protein
MQPKGSTGKPTSALILALELAKGASATLIDADWERSIFDQIEAVYGEFGPKQGAKTALFFKLRQAYQTSKCHES